MSRDTTQQPDPKHLRKLADRLYIMFKTLEIAICDQIEVKRIRQRLMDGGGSGAERDAIESLENLYAAHVAAESSFTNLAEDDDK